VFSGIKMQSMLVAFVFWFCLGARAQTVEQLHVFSGPDGDWPLGNLIEAQDGDLYGTTLSGGQFGRGSVYRLSSNGEFASFFSFDDTNGAAPWSGLMQTLDGGLYGTTYSENGSIFKITTQGHFTQLFQFQGTNGSGPSGELIQGADGALYGTTRYGGTNLIDPGCLGCWDNAGTVFRVTTNGIFTSLITFNFTNGSVPWSGIVQGKDGYLYGTTIDGGPLDSGTVFKADTNRVLTTLFSFSEDGSGESCQTPLIHGLGTNLWGVTRLGSTTGNGTLFRVTPAGVYTVLTAFGPAGSPTSNLLVGPGGAFYGLLLKSGSNHVFKVTPAGVLTVIASLPDDSNYSTIMQAKDGRFYITMSGSFGVTTNKGSIYRLTLPTLEGSPRSNSIVLSWPTNMTGFTVQGSTNMDRTSWTNLNVSPTVVNGYFTLTNNPAGPTMFYRLAK
jgi:uncharacterized repeat protein (TIGR03803 family)